MTGPNEKRTPSVFFRVEIISPGNGNRAELLLFLLMSLPFLFCEFLNEIVSYEYFLTPDLYNL